MYFSSLPRFLGRGFDLSIISHIQCEMREAFLMKFELHVLYDSRPNSLVLVKKLRIRGFDLFLAHHNNGENEIRILE